MKNLTKKQAKKFAQMYVSGLALHHTFTLDADHTEDDVDNITNEIKSIAYRTSPTDEIFVSTDQILLYVRAHF